MIIRPNSRFYTKCNNHLVSFIKVEGLFDPYARRALEWFPRVAPSHLAPAGDARARGVHSCLKSRIPSFGIRSIYLASLSIY